MERPPHRHSVATGSLLPLLPLLLLLLLLLGRAPRMSGRARLNRGGEHSANISFPLLFVLFLLVGLGLAQRFEGGKARARGRSKNKVSISLLARISNRAQMEIRRQSKGTKGKWKGIRRKSRVHMFVQRALSCTSSVGKHYEIFDPHSLLQLDVDVVLFLPQQNAQGHACQEKDHNCQTSSSAKCSPHLATGLHVSSA